MTLARAAFERGVRRLDGRDAGGFVADLLEARGYRTSVGDRVVTAADSSGGSTRLLVVDGVRSLPAVSRTREPGVDAVLVTDSRLGPAARSLAARASRGAGSDPAAVLGPETLYEWFAYAVDAEARSALAERYLDATEPTALDRGRAALADAVGTVAGRLGRLRPPSRRPVSVVLVALLVLAVAATAGPAGPLATTGPASNGDAGPTPAVTAVPVDATPAPATTEAGAALPEVCPPPPLEVHPAALRPGVIRTASAGGLDGWRVLATQNISEHEFDPNDQRAGAVPDIRHIAVFETSGGVQLRLVLDRWESVARAERAVTEGGAWALGLRWGSYTAGVEWDAGDASGDASARHLLAAVRAPGGVQLGGACVSALASGAATNGGSATA